LTCSPCGGGLKYWLNGRCFCGQSCCDRYWGEWVSDPPDCCDPCNQCGNFVGPRCCGPGPLRRLWYAISCTGCCNSCGGSGCDICGGGYAPGYSGSAGYNGYASQGHGGCSTCGGGGGGYGNGHGYGNGSLMHENWDQAVPTPVPGKNIPQATQPTPAMKMTQRPVAQPAMAQRRPASPVQQATMRR
jgi:hypothetical protein